VRGPAKGLVTILTAGLPTIGGSSMNKEQATGKAKEIKGKVKEKLGFITSDPDTESKGVKDQIEGKVKQAHGKAKEEFVKKHTP
jgi:uncharacterized protein YjbJ (UPF0337 family)